MAIEPDTVYFELTQDKKTILVRASDISYVLPTIPQGKRKPVGSIIITAADQSIYVDQSIQELSEMLEELLIDILPPDTELYSDEEDEEEDDKMFEEVLVKGMSVRMLDIPLHGIKETQIKLEDFYKGDTE